MEILFELLVPVLEFLAEIFLQVAFEWLAELGFRALRAPFKSERETSPEFAAVGYALFGMAAGALSLLVFPSSFVHSPVARIVNLVISPVIAGMLMAVLGAWRRRRGQDLIRLDRFAYGLLFAFAMAAVRFFFALHGS